MNVAVVGAGAVGGLVAAHLAAAGHEVLLCVRTPFDRLEVESAQGTARPDVTITAVPDEHKPADWVLVTTKAQDTASTGPWLAALVGADTVVALPQNGIDHADRVAGLVPAGTHVLPVVVHAPVERVAPGRIVRRGFARMTVPADEDGAGFRRLFDGSGIDVLAEPDFRTAAWRKLFSNVAGNPITALTSRRMDVLADGDVRALGEAVVREAVAVAGADGAAVDDAEVDRVMARWDEINPADGSSMLYDRLAGRPLEHEYITGAVVRYADRHGVDVPLNRALLTLLRALDEGTRAPA